MTRSEESITGYKKVPVLTHVQIIDGDNDSYGHLNNSAYPKYFERGRRRAMQHFLGVSDDELIKRGIGLWIRESNYRFITPVDSNLFLLIRSYAPVISGIRLIGTHELIHIDNPLTVAEISQFFVDICNKKPIRLNDKRIEDILENLSKA